MSETFVKYKYLLAIILLSFGFISNMESQNCKGYEKKCEEAPKYFEKSSLSRSLTVRKGRKIIINQTFFENREYFIAVCGKKQLGDIHLRLIADNDKQMVLFDNATTNFKSSQLFVIQNTVNVKIEFTAPHYFDKSNSECAGIQIFYHQSKL